MCGFVPWAQHLSRVLAELAWRPQLLFAAVSQFRALKEHVTPDKVAHASNAVAGTDMGSADRVKKMAFTIPTGWPTLLRPFRFLHSGSVHSHMISRMPGLRNSGLFTVHLFEGLDHWHAIESFFRLLLIRKLR